MSKPISTGLFATGIFLFFGVFTMHTIANAGNPPGVVDLPAIDQLPVIEDLPDPLLMKDGKRVTNPDEWAERREEIKAMMLYYQYGHMPPAPDNLTVDEVSTKPIHNNTATEKILLFSMGPEKKITFNARLVVPKGDGPFPVLLQNTKALNNIPIEEEVVRRGYMAAEYLRTDLDPDENNNVGKAQSAYPEYDWATLAVWAWGGMRVVDYLMTLDCVDKEKIAFTGHSRGGKTALLGGALDERITLVNPNGSGCGGAGCYRIQGERSETLAQITDPERFCYWFHPRFRQFAGKETQLPFDQHFLKAMVAPRALLCTDAFGDRWANPPGTQATTVAAQPVFDLLGVGDKNGLHYREGKHAHSAEDWSALMDFADKVFFGKTVDRDFYSRPFSKKE